MRRRAWSAARSCRTGRLRAGARDRGLRIRARPDDTQRYPSARRTTVRTAAPRNRKPPRASGRARSRASAPHRRKRSAPCASSRRSAASPMARAAPKIPTTPPFRAAARARRRPSPSPAPTPATAARRPQRAFPPSGRGAHSRRNSCSHADAPARCAAPGSAGRSRDCRALRRARRVSSTPCMRLRAGRAARRRSGKERSASATA